MELLVEVAAEEEIIQSEPLDRMVALEEYLEMVALEALNLLEELEEILELLDKVELELIIFKLALEEEVS